MFCGENWHSCFAPSFPGDMTDINVALLPFPTSALGYAFRVRPEQSLSGCQQARLSSGVLLLMTWLWEFTCLTSDAVLGTLLVLIFGQSLRNHLALRLATGLTDSHLYSFTWYGLVFFLF